MMTDVYKIDNLDINEECWLCSFVLSTVHGICCTYQAVNDRGTVQPCGRGCWLAGTISSRSKSHDRPTDRPTDLTTGDPNSEVKSEISKF